ncbi:hypothetical protein [Caniella muris]|uniref:hypothetical protein n=1 Tax=Caniella muris TaxID=2941502 RepID=UPI00203B894B|nr:hypothetical protein [Caniella muris]
MQADDVVRALADRYSGSVRELSADMGRSPNYLHTSIYKRSDPRVGTVAEIGDFVGVDVCLVDRATGETIATIDPPIREED